ncbi:S8 family serine peptidase [Streptomyces sp. NPDC002896]|uniref:S8 family serine peptidase n=1 Tax=Streptomyces sp. NPDC002896 TaxID=3154438 RepID=UPI003333CA71
MSTVCSALGALAALSAGLAPSAVADDVQSQQWYLDAMKADEMWKVSTGKGVKIAVIDSGVNPETPSLRGKVLVDEVRGRAAYHVTKDYTGHGTSMAEIIAGTGADGGLRGLAPGAEIVPYRIAYNDLKGTEARKTASSAEAIKAAADSDSKIINMSYGAYLSYQGEREAVKYAASKGKLMFASVGNDADTHNLPEYPAAYPYVVGVAAADESGTVGKFSEHGDYIDLAAPGRNIPVWCDETLRSYCAKQGTSQASAIASASAALIWSAHPRWTANQVLRALIDTASRSWPKNKPSNYLGYGLIRPRKILEDKNINPGPAKSDPLSYENWTGETDSSASPSAAASSQAPKSTSGGQTSAAGSSSKSADSTTLWTILGAVAAVVVIGVGAFAATRKRRGA